MVQFFLGLAYFAVVILLYELFEFVVGLVFFDGILVLAALQQVEKVVDMFSSFEQHGDCFGQNGFALGRLDLLQFLASFDDFLNGGMATYSDSSFY